MEQYFRVGVITNTHGVRGEVKVYPTTDDIKRFDYLKEALIDAPDGYVNVKVEKARYFKNFVILKFFEYNNLDEVLPYKGRDLLVDRKNAIPLGEGEAFVADLIGCSVIEDNGNRLGVLSDVMKTGANDVYVVRTDDGREVLLPAIDECILDKDVGNGIVRVHMMKGLLD